MSKLKKISTSIPEALLKKACSLSELNQTDTLIAGLKELVAQAERREVIKLKGKIKIDLNLDKTRERVRL
jgi:hypothetical protein